MLNFFMDKEVPQVVGAGDFECLPEHLQIDARHHSQLEYAGVFRQLLLQGLYQTAAISMYCLTVSSSS